MYAIAKSWSDGYGNTLGRSFAFGQTLKDVAKLYIDSCEEALRRFSNFDIDSPDYAERVASSNATYKKLVYLRDKVRHDKEITEKDITDTDYTYIGPYYFYVQVKEINDMRELKDYVDMWCYTMGEDVLDRLNRAKDDREMGDILYEVQDRFNAKLKK